MATRVLAAPTVADNCSGSLPAARSDWRNGDADSMSARDASDPTTDAGLLSSRCFPNSQSIDQPLAVEGESIYEGLDLGFLVPCTRRLT